MRARFKNVTEAMRAAGVDLLVLTPGADLFYLTHFEHGHAGERLLALTLRSDGSAQWIAPAMNVPQVQERALSGEEIRSWSDAEGYLPALRAVVRDAATIAFDDEARAAFLLDLIEAAPRARLRPASTILRGLRIRKTAAELDALSVEGRRVDQAIVDAVALCRPGKSEQQIDRELREILTGKQNAPSVAFTIIAGGANSSLPHHETGPRRLEPGDVVILDFGTQGSVTNDSSGVNGHSQLFGYRSDITVTCSVGEPKEPAAHRVYAVVWEAQQAAIAAIRSGVCCSQVDRAARSVIEQAGYGPCFLHRTGHGLGLQGHEPPYLTATSDEVLEPGMVVSVEPGIYLSGRFGVRLEIIVAVTSNGARLLNQPSSPELLICRKSG